ncbi:MAG: tRNA-guanine transglycosylase [Terriglobales bacterium]
MGFAFQIEARCGAARVGRLLTPHGEVTTPVFMPVGTQGTVKGVGQEALEELGAQLLLANTYHLMLRPGHEVVRRLGGLHRFMSWERALLTDSGGYQVFSLAERRKVTEEGVEFRSHLDGALHFLSPEKAMEVQQALGADVIMALDECTEYPAGRERVRESLELTVRWGERCREASSQQSAISNQERQNRAELRSAARARSPVPTHSQDASESPGSTQQGRGPSTALGSPRSAQDDSGGRQALFGIVQGGMHAELRRESAERTVAMGFDGYAIGGLSVGEPRALTQEMVAATLPHLPGERPRYLMGVGTPEEIVEYAAQGVDMMDCVLPTRAGRHGLLYTSEGRLNIKQARFAEDAGPPDPSCGCRVCARYTRAYLRHLFVAGEALGGVLNTVHNLAYYLDTLRAVRHAIQVGNLAEFLSGYRSRCLNSPIAVPGEDPA